MISSTNLLKLLFLLLFPVIGLSQINKEAETLLNKGEEFFKKADIITAFNFFKKASNLVTYQDNLNQKVIANTGIGMCYIQMEKFKEAETILDSTYNYVNGLLPDTSIVFLNLKKYTSWAYGYNEDIDKEFEMSFELIENYKACNGDMRSKIADTYNTISISYNIRGDYQNEYIYIRKAVALMDSLFNEKEPTIQEEFERTNMFNSYSISSLVIGNYENALLYANKCITFYNQYLPQYRAIAASYMVKSKYFAEYEKQLDSALFYIEKATNHLEADFGDGFPGIHSQPWLSYKSYKARILKEYGKYEKANETLNDICRVRNIGLDNTPNNFSPGLIVVFNELGANNHQLGKLDEAIQWYEKGLSSVKEKHFNDYPILQVILSDLSKVYMQNGEIDKAIFSQEQALELVGFHFWTNDFIESDQLILYDSPIKCGKEIALFLSNNSKELADHLNVSETGVLLKSLEYFKKTIEIQTKKRLYLFEVGVNEGFKTEHIDLYEGALALLYRLQEEQFGQYYNKEALWVVEMAKSNLLKEAIYNENLYDKVLSPEDKNKHNLLRAQIFEARKNLNIHNDSTLETMHLTKSNYLQFKSEIKERYPVLKSEQTTQNLTLSDIDSALTQRTPKNELIVNYFQGENHLYYTVTTGKNVRIFQKEISSEFISDIAKVRNLFFIDTITGGLTKADNNWFEVTSQNWYNLLIADAIKTNPKASKITIVPHRNINFISMDYVGYKDGDHLHYLIEDYPILYNYSQFTRPKNNQNKVRTPFGGFAVSDCENNTENDFLYEELTRSHNGRLPGTRSEVENISTLLKGDVFYQNTQEEFISKSANYAVLHIAMHAIADNHNPDQSRLYFCSENSGSNSLTASDLSTMDINADMTVLSACNTGVGKMKDGEGVLSLMRVFLQTGSNAVVSSLWEIPDEKTAVIMIDFYRELSKNKTKSEALRQAKLNYLANSDSKYKMPYFWSGLVIYGDDAPLDQSFFKSPPLLARKEFYFGLFILIVVAILFYRFKASKS